MKGEGLSARDANPPDRTVPTSTYLEQLAAFLLQTTASRNSAQTRPIIEKYLAPSVKVGAAKPYNNVLNSTSREAYIETLRVYLAAHPSYAFRTINTTAQVDEKLGQATVFATNIASGIIVENAAVTRESVSVLHFQRALNSEWIYMGIEVMRGPGHFLFDVGRC